MAETGRAVNPVLVPLRVGFSQFVPLSPPIWKGEHEAVKLKLIIFHALGISTTLAAFITELLMFFDISTQGYFHATESNPLILGFEIFLALFGLAYFLTLIKRIATACQN